MYRKWEDKWRSTSKGRPQLLLSSGCNPGLFLLILLSWQSSFSLPTLCLGILTDVFFFPVLCGVLAPSSSRACWVIQQEVAATLKSKQYLSLVFETASYKTPLTFRFADIPSPWVIPWNFYVFGLKVMLLSGNATFCSVGSKSHQFPPCIVSLFALSCVMLKFIVVQDDLG